MTRRPRSTTPEAGQDSFLDIVANLVGILIILVMVIGVRAKDAIVSQGPEPPTTEELAALREEATVAATTARALESNVNQVQARIRQADLEIAYRRRERDKVLQLLTAAKMGIDERRDQLGQVEREQFERKRRLAALESQLEDLKLSRHQIENAEPPTGVIKHLPTPLAQTVFGKEIHFRLQAGRLAYVPMNELVEQLKAEAPRQVWKLNQAPQITEVLGPISGFRMKYTLKQVTRTVPSRNGAATQRGIELDHFVLVPVREGLGTPLDEALLEGSELDTILAGQRPRQTTITVWVYPDSFDRFRKLKEHLFQRGFLTAGRPMPADQPIGGSPSGSRSAAQ